MFFKKYQLTNFQTSFPIEFNKLLTGNKTLVIPHFHEYFEIIKVLDGPINLSLDVKNYICNTGDLIIIPSMVMHSATIEDTSKSICSVLFDPNCLTSSTLHYNFNELLNADKFLKFIISPSDSVYNSLNEYFTKVLTCCDSDSYNIKIKIIGCLLLISSALIDTTLSSGDEHIYKKDYHITAAVEYINENYMNKITLSMLANLLNTCPDNATRLFKKNLLLTPTQYINFIRLKHVTRYLVTTSKSLDEISSLTGFNSVEYMCRCFKKSFRTTPNKYRIEYHSK